MSVDQVIKSFYFQWLRTVMTNLLLKGLHKQSKSRVNSEEWQCSYKTSVNLYLVGLSMYRRFFFIFYVVSFLFHQISFYYTHCVQICFCNEPKEIPVLIFILIVCCYQRDYEIYGNIALHFCGHSIFVTVRFVVLFFLSSINNWSYLEGCRVTHMLAKYVWFYNCIPADMSVRQNKVKLKRAFKT